MPSATPAKMYCCKCKDKVAPATTPKHITRKSKKTDRVTHFWHSSCKKCGCELYQIRAA